MEVPHCFLRRMGIAERWVASTAHLVGFALLGRSGAVDSCKLGVHGEGSAAGAEPSCWGWAPSPQRSSPGLMCGQYFFR